MYNVLLRQIALIVLFAIPLFAQSNRYVTVSNVRARAFALGGAFTSIKDDLAAPFYNPAAFSLYANKKAGRLTFFVNPISTVISGLKIDEMFSGAGSTEGDILLSIGQVVKSVTLSMNALEFGLILGEQSLRKPQSFYNDEILNIAGFRQNHSHLLVSRLKLADQVSIGASASLIYSSLPTQPLASQKNISLSYGILIQPEKGLSVGVSLINLPDTISEHRLSLERVVDETVNVGVSYNYNGSTITLDVKNIGDETVEIVREFHVGFEQNFLSHISLRAGWFKRANGGHVYSCGIGLIDGNSLWNLDRLFNHKNLFLNYAFVYEDNEIQDLKWHFLSFNIRI